MITEEQIKNLKPGDILTVSGTLNRIDETNGIWINFPYRIIWFPYSSVFLHTDSQSKYDPTRPFKNGDIVRYVERDGRCYVDAPPVGATCRVCGGEDRVGMVCVEFKFSENEESARHEVPFYHLELVTPVEELEPYKLIDSPNTYNIVRGSATVMTIHKKSHPNAKAAAEAERDRLNEEWRKEQNND